MWVHLTRVVESCQNLSAFESAGMYGPVVDDGLMFAADPSACGVAAAPTPVDLRCQGYNADLCGCLQVPSIAADPYFGCVISGYNAAAEASAGNNASLPLVTLPGVVDTATLNLFAGPCVDRLRPTAAAAPCAFVFCLVLRLYVSVSCSKARCGLVYHGYSFIHGRTCCGIVQCCRI